VFGRPPDYDTGQDAIVRVKANEVRRRLAQYYIEAGTGGDVRFELLPGSYLLTFKWKEKSEPQIDAPLEVQAESLNRLSSEISEENGAPADVTPSSSWGIRRQAIALGFGALLLGILIGLGTSKFLKPDPATKRPEDHLIEEFWRPVIQNRNPALICLGHPVVYHLARRVHEQYQQSHPNAQWPYAIELSPKEQLTGEDIIPVTDQYLGVGDAQAASQLMALFSRLNKSAQMRLGNDLSFSDLRNAPTIMIGAFSNRWTMEIGNDLRYVFGFNDRRQKVIQDRHNASRFWKPPSISPVGKVSEDYGLISRVLNSNTGGLTITAAGITQYGSQAAGEFLTDSNALSEALSSAPAGWQQKNLQIIIETRVIGSTPSPPKVIESYFW